MPPDWRPIAPSTTFTTMLHYLTLPVTAFAQNCSLVWCDETLEAAVIDPGGDLPLLLAAGVLVGLFLNSIVAILKFAIVLLLVWGVPITTLFLWRRVTQTAVVVQVAVTLLLATLGLEFSFRQWMIFWGSVPFGVAFLGSVTSL